MRQPRYRLRTLLIAVAVTALALAGWRWLERGRSCLARARVYRAFARQDRAFAEDMGKVADIFRRELAIVKIDPDHVPAVDPAMLPRDPRMVPQALEERVANALRKSGDYRAKSAEQGRIAEQYERAALYPWLPLPTVTPPPD